jgi:hypothetical protein
VVHWVVVDRQDSITNTFMQPDHKRSALLFQRRAHR